MSPHEITSVIVPSINDKISYRIKTIWNEYDFSLTILDKDNAFKANVTKNELENWAKKYELPFNKYYTLIRSSLTNDTDDRLLTDEMFLFELIEDRLFISRRENCVTVQLANFKLHKLNFLNTVEEYIDDISKAVFMYKTQLRNCQKECELLLSEKTNSSQKLEEYTILKEEMEQELYSKFILILNEKKQRIQYLQEMLDAYKCGHIESDKEVKENASSDMEIDDKPSSSVLNKREVISDSESDNDQVNYYEMQTQLQVENHKCDVKKSFLDDEVIPSIGAIEIPNKKEEMNVNVEEPNDNKLHKPVGSKSSEIALSDTQASFNTLELLERL